MSYYSAGRRGDDEDVDDFDEYDPTPYGGGYDLALTFGRPLPPSDDICYTLSSSSDGIDYERPQYSSYSQTSAYAAGDDEGRYDYSRPKPPKPAYTSYGEEKEEIAHPEPNYGFRPGMNRPGYEGGGDSGYGGRPEPEADYGSGYGGRPKREEYGFESDRPSRYGENYPPPRRPEEEEGGGGSYGFQKSEEYGVGGRTGKPTYGRPENETPTFERPSYGRQEEEEEPRRPTYGRPSYEEPPRRPTYGRPSFGQQEEEEEPRRHQETSYYDPDQGEGYSSRPKYGDDSDDEEKKRRHHKHHHRKYSDDE